MHDFYSDTQSRPTRAMREAALDNPLGDERHDADPSTLALCARVADMLGMEAEPRRVCRRLISVSFAAMGSVSSAE
jgi:threonine aldolase